METNIDYTYKSIALIIVALVIIIASIFCINDELNASAEEPDTITLKAGTYRFNDVLTKIEGNIDGYVQDLNFTFVSNQAENWTIEDFSNIEFFPNVTCYGTQIGQDVNGSVRYLYSHNGDGTTYNHDIYLYGGAVEGWRYANYITYEQIIALGLNPPDGFVYMGEGIKTITLPSDAEVDVTFGEWYIANTNYNEVNGNNSITIPYTNFEIPSYIQIMENINMDINGFGSTTYNDNVGISALNGDTLGRLRTNDDTFISFNGIAVTSFDSWRTLSTYAYPLTDEVIPTQPFTIYNGLMLYVWDDTQYYQVAWYNPDDQLWYVHGDYAIIVPYGHRSTQGIGTLTDGISLSLSITPNLSVDDIGYVELGGFEDTPPYDNIITGPDDDAYSTFAMFCNANYNSDSEKLSWGIAQHQSGLNLGQSQQLGENILGQFLQAPVDILDSIVIYTTPGGTDVTLMGVFGGLLTLSLVIIFLKLFAGG